MNLSEEGIQLIIEFESGGRSYWQNKCLDKPNWPGFSSGVTIGIGYDLGYCTASKFVSDWQEIYGERDLYQLKNVCGITGEDAKLIIRADGPLHEVRSISWDDAVTVFRQASLPTHYVRMLRVYPQSESIPAKCATALLSLVFNRGTDTRVTASNDRRLEMLQIKEALSLGKLDLIPGYLRSMKRLWPSTSGLPKRREREALFFEDGLKS